MKVVNKMYGIITGSNLYYEWEIRRFGEEHEGEEQTANTAILAAYAFIKVHTSPSYEIVKLESTVNGVKYSLGAVEGKWYINKDKQSYDSPNTARLALAKLLDSKSVNTCHQDLEQ